MLHLTVGVRFSLSDIRGLCCFLHSEALRDVFFVLCGGSRDLCSQSVKIWDCVNDVLYGGVINIADKSINTASSRISSFDACSSVLVQNIQEG